MDSQINLLPKQTEAWEYIFETDSVTEVGYGGAAGGGKSVLGSYMAIVLSEMYPGARGVIGRKELKNLKRTTMVSLFNCLTDLGYKQAVDYTYNDQTSELTFKNNSKVIFMDMSHSPQDTEYTRFGGLEITWAWIDESNEVPEKAKAILKTRVGRHNVFGKEHAKPVFLETFNPNKGHVYNDYYKPWKDGSLPDYRRFVRALPGDNPYLPKAYIDNLARSDKTTKERLLFGNFDYDDDPTTLMAQDAIYDLYTNTIPRDATRYITADVARFGRDKTVVGVWEGLELIKIETMALSGVDETVALIKTLAKDFSVPYSQIIADEDGVGGGVLDFMRGIKGFMGGSSPFEVWNHTLGRRDRQNFKNIRHQCYFSLADYVNNHKMRVSDVTGKTEIIEELGVVKRKNEVTDGKLEIISKDDIKTLLGRSPDYADMIMMRMWFEFKKVQTNKQPGTFNIHRRTFNVKQHDL